MAVPNIQNAQVSQAEDARGRSGGGGGCEFWAEKTHSSNFPLEPKIPCVWDKSRLASSPPLAARRLLGH